MLELTIPLRSHDEAILVLGPYDRHAKLLRKSLDIDVYSEEGGRRAAASSQVWNVGRFVVHEVGELVRCRAGRHEARDDTAVVDPLEARCEEVPHPFAPGVLRQVVHRKELRTHLTNLLSHMKNTPIVKKTEPVKTDTVEADTE